MTAQFFDDPAWLRVASPPFSDAQMARLRSYGTPQHVSAGEVIFAPGDRNSELMLVDEGEVELTRPAIGESPEETIVTFRPGDFVGELRLLTGQAAFLTARMIKSGRLYRIPAERFRRLMAEDPELSDLLLNALLARRDMLQQGAASYALEIVGSTMNSDSLGLRTYASRRRLPHQWFDADSVAGRALMRAEGLHTHDLPAVVTTARTLRRTTAAELAEHLGLTYHRDGDAIVDLLVIGAGPAGLAAGVYAASEGLETVILDAVGPGGQAAASPRIENYLGFPLGLSGNELTQRAVTQALRFGARLASPCQTVELDTDDANLRARLKDGTSIAARAVVIASGARYRALPLERWQQFVGAGIFYAATEIEARACAGKPVTVLGGGNSAGQAALYLASRECEVAVAIRGRDVAAGMSSYLVDRLLADPRVTVHTDTHVTAVEGDVTLEQIELTTGKDVRAQQCNALFCFIGADAATEWLTDVAVDQHGFIRTDRDLGADAMSDAWTTLGRAPLPFETSIPSVFAVGDVRHGSTKRIAAAVGEGASAVQSVHLAIGARAA